MSQARQEPQASLRMRRIFPASIDRVFRAWTSPEALRQWWGPPGHATPEAEVDLRPGGKYRLGMRKLPAGNIFYLSGTFVEVQPPERLVYTWAWERPDWEPEQTLVTVEFHARGDRTEVILTHELLPSQAELEAHTQGWQGCLDGLEQYLSTQ